MICLTECSPLKAPDGRTHVIDTATSSAYRVFKHSFVSGEDGADYTTTAAAAAGAGSSSSAAQQQQQKKASTAPLAAYSATSVFLPIGAGTVLLSQEQHVIHCCSLAQGHPVSRCVTPEKITAATPSPCARFLALGGESGAVYFMSCQTGEMLWLRKGHVRAVTCLAFSADSNFLCSASQDTTCRTVRIGASASSHGGAGADSGGMTMMTMTMGGAGGENRGNNSGSNTGRGFGGGVVIMTGHTLAVTGCAFTTFVHRVVSVSKDRTCRISDPLSGAVLRVFNTSQPLCSVCVGPADSVFACGASNGAIVFFSAPTTGAVVSSGSSLFTPGASDSFSNNEECRVVGPFSGGPQGPVFFVSRIFGAFESSTASSAMTTATGSSSSSSSVVGTDALTVVSRDGFCQLYSWSTGAFIRDVVHYPRGIMAASVVPGLLSQSPQWTNFAISTLSDRALIQRSSLPLKKAPVSAAGSRAFQMKAAPAALLDSAEFAAANSVSGRRRERCGDSADSAGKAAMTAQRELLESIELEALLVRKEELLAEANRLYAEAAEAGVE